MLQIRGCSPFYRNAKIDSLELLDQLVWEMYKGVVAQVLQMFAGLSAV